ncbi:hypothetical protein KW783_02820 [Candidatus Parcubacteria bacterium]|nr:hypothetical protein [Candidatus Parcubacteria bacterium]
MEPVSIDDFKKIKIAIGEIVTAEKVPDSDKLLKLTVNFGAEVRQVISGIAQTYTDPSVLIGVSCPFVTNLLPRTILGLESQAMILAAKDLDGKIVLLKPDKPIPAGATLS